MGRRPAWHYPHCLLLPGQALPLPPTLLLLALHCIRSGPLFCPPTVERVKKCVREWERVCGQNNYTAFFTHWITQASIPNILQLLLSLEKNRWTSKYMYLIHWKIRNTLYQSTQSPHVSSHDDVCVRGEGGFGCHPGERLLIWELPKVSARRDYPSRHPDCRNASNLAG